ncbi:MFS transporter [Thermodesulfobacteriota bacterium]
MREDVNRPTKRIYYGWYIVGVGFLANTAAVFSLSSTLGVFMKPLTADLGVSRGVFSLLRSGESLISASLSPLVGSMVDRHGGRWLMTFGAVVVGIGFLMLSQVEAFWQFLCVRWTLHIGDAFMAYLVVNVAISRWFIRKRGRAIAFSSMGVGFAKIGIPIITASLIAWYGWRMAWAVFGILTLILVVGPAAIYMRRRPEDMGFRPDGDSAPSEEASPSKGKSQPSTPHHRTLAEEVAWSRPEAVRTSTFWLIVTCLIFAHVGVAGLNLHLFSYVSDTSGSEIVAASVLSTLAFTQLSFPLIWGFVAERVEVRFALFLKFLIQASGLLLAISSARLFPLYFGFFLYGIGVSGGMVLPDLLWAHYFGRLSLGSIRGLGLMMVQTISAVGPPFFGFLFDITGSYFLSFTLLIVALTISANLCLVMRPPTKRAA